MSNPGFIVCSCCSVRTTRPAAIRTTSEIAIWATTKTLLNRVRPAPPCAAVSFKVPKMFGRVACSAGARPKTAPATIDTPSEKSSTRQSTSISSASGKSIGGFSASNTLMIQSANNKPTAPPTNESKILSVRSCRIRRSRFAPIAKRIAISLRRSVARASIRPARLVQVTSSTSPTAAIITHVKFTTAPRRSGRMKPGGVMRMDCPSFVSGYSLPSCWLNKLSETSACGALTPLLSRPIPKKFFARRESIQVEPGSIHSIIEAGTQISGE